MISQLTIQNFGLIDRLSINFCGKLNVFTGETGAGKSILLDALRFALGERLNSSQIRDAGKPCIVEVVLELPERYFKNYPAFLEYVSDEDRSIIINRAVLPDGRNRIKLNGFTLTVSQLKELGNHLIDFHGPSDHQLLLSPNSHIGILDRLSKTSGLLSTYSAQYKEYAESRNREKQLEEMAESRERDLDLLSHQIKELEQAPLSDEKYGEFASEQARINNAEKLYEHVNRLIELFENEEYGITETVRKAFTPMEKLNEVDAETADLYGLLDNIQENSSELLSLLKQYSERLSYAPEKTEEINRLSDVYYEIKRKYGPSLKEAAHFYERSREKYDTLMNIEHDGKDLKNATAKLLKKLTETAAGISKKRKETAGMLKNTVEEELKELGIKHVRFECRIERSEINRNGCDKVTFHISPNAGENLKPLAEIVSSGEAARLMLALKKALTKVDPIPVLIFDEIDSQIGGRLGTITGRKLKEIADDRQVILITHLPQIASFGDHHFNVSKNVKNGRTVTSAALLNPEDRIKELAKMMSGETESGISVKHARDMLTKAN